MVYPNFLRPFQACTKSDEEPGYANAKAYVSSSSVCMYEMLRE